MHLQIGYKSITIRSGAEAGPGAQVHPGKAESGRNERSRGSAIGLNEISIQKELSIKLAWSPTVQHCPNG